MYTVCTIYAYVLIKVNRWAKLQHSMEAVRIRREMRLQELKRRKEAEDKNKNADIADGDPNTNSANNVCDILTVI